jgi:hypothetical protein
MDTVGLFNINLGRVNSCLLSGEEREFVERVRAHGFSLAYAAKGYVFHRVPLERLTIAWLSRRHFWQGVTNQLCDRHSWFFPFLRIPKMILTLLSVLLASILCSRKRLLHAWFNLAEAGGLFHGAYLQLRTAARDTHSLT